MGKVSVRSALEKKEVVIEPPIDVRVLQRGYFRRKLELMPHAYSRARFHRREAFTRLIQVQLHA